MESSPSLRPRRLDVRPLLGQPGEPFRTIMETVAALGPAQTLLLSTPFLPSPIIEKLKAEGFEARPARLADGSWETRFQRN
jgi:hypothetical protein